MSGDTQRKSRRNKKSAQEQAAMAELPDRSEAEPGDGTAGKADHDHTEALRAGLASISRDIKSLHQNIREELQEFKNDIKSEMKQELTLLREDIDHKLRENSKELQEQKAKLAEAEGRITELEEWNTDANETLLNLLNQTRHMQDKITEQEARSQRNNIRIFGLPEETEGSSMMNYLDQLLRAELELPEETQLQIQRAHRTPPLKRSAGAPPRAVVVNFLQFETKEMILKKVWQKKVKVGEKIIWFDHDYPPEIVQKRRSYQGIKTALREKSIRFQTPFTKIRIHWNDGVKSYENAREATRDMRARGFTLDMPNDSDERGERRLLGARRWQRVRDGGPNRDTAQRAREKLQEYQRE